MLNSLVITITAAYQLRNDNITPFDMLVIICEQVYPLTLRVAFDAVVNVWLFTSDYSADFMAL